MSDADLKREAQNGIDYNRAIRVLLDNYENDPVVIRSIQRIQKRMNRRGRQVESMLSVLAGEPLKVNL
jgi:hypothetical protein